MGFRLHITMYSILFLFLFTFDSFSQLSGKILPKNYNLPARKNEKSYPYQKLQLQRTVTSGPEVTTRLRTPDSELGVELRELGVGSRKRSWKFEGVELLDSEGVENLKESNSSTPEELKIWRSSTPRLRRSRKFEGVGLPTPGVLMNFYFA